MAIIFHSKNPGNILAGNIAIFFDKILANLNILPKIIAEVLLSLWLEKDNFLPRILLYFTAKVLLKYCCTFSYRGPTINVFSKNIKNFQQKILNCYITKILSILHEHVFCKLVSETCGLKDLNIFQISKF